MSTPSTVASEDPQVVSDSVRPDLFREAMTRFASGVTIVTTADPEGRWWGFTASAFSSLSLEPALVLVCLATSAESHPVFEQAPSFVINILRHDQEELALRFGRRGANKFDGGEFRPGRTDGLPVLDSSMVSLKCRAHTRYEGGDHTILIGAVEYVILRSTSRPALHYSRRFWDVVEPAATDG